jgi:hypothetical protein
MFYLTIFTPLSVSGKLTGTLRDPSRVLSQLLSACCVFGARC